MKLLNLTNRYYFLAFGVAFVIVSFVSYFILKHVIDKEFNEKLHAEKEQFLEEFDTYDQLEEVLFLNIGDVITIHQVPAFKSKSESITDTSMYDTYEKKVMDYRRLTFGARHNGKNYQVTIHKSLVNNNDLLEAIGEIMILVVFFFMASLIFINIILSQKLWQPFYKSLATLRAFDIKEPKPINLRKEKIYEFSQLNEAVNQLVDKNLKDYQNLKEYTENASHEIQTPLAIIQHKTELLLQRELPEEQLAHISEIRKASLRLSRLKEGLATFSRIENNQYVERSAIRLDDYMRELIQNIQDLMDFKQIDCELDIDKELTIELNETLAYLLFNNLLSNAIKYNLTPGYLKVKTNGAQFLMENAGAPLDMNAEDLFIRFKRTGNQQDSTGLGLALVKRIVDLYQVSIRYENVDQNHRIELDLSSIMKN